ncbi:SIS domain-containing protein [Spongiactinospora sp. TRM90649]|uniref:SIS domain-containing protein n=1 Tax=Spongiactinospora sp. TRM90649 TaxID=3031114 RepID=UPI0023F9FF58|nr:SIS domain-containing protein [Spongiactinospora sp. TRM90649]MDF5757658.1 SIS domain-containing protein [Spongiactinospora sp. TRM90649]
MTVLDHPLALQVLREVMDRVVATQLPAIDRAARLCADALAADGIVQAFGTGHSRAFAMEIAGRAGGLIPANQLGIKDVVMFGGADPSEILDPTRERDPALAHRVWELHDVRPSDVVLIASNSGINGAIVEMAELARANGNPVVAITSVAHSTSAASRHPSGRRLFEVADVVIDNCGVPGDSAYELPSGARILPTSTLTGTLIAQLLNAAICADLLGRGIEPAIYLSANIEGGSAHNDRLLAHYGERVRVSEP